MNTHHPLFGKDLKPNFTSQLKHTDLGAREHVFVSPVQGKRRWTVLNSADEVQDQHMLWTLNVFSRAGYSRVL